MRFGRNTSGYAARPQPRHRQQRFGHRLALCVDRDVLHTAVIVAATCALSAGLVYVGYFVYVLRIARKAPCVPDRGECILLFGKHAPQGRLHRDFEARPLSSA